ncbi:hypothetical protein [Pseudonocardia sp. N23]|uniref:hypothetical protein n=1 Tax=Pseudonocardia sp. N23 TaxID=1987376 RepID=UPI000BFBE848|nr:hypothetical protein [Pseudonocardia sp. N23]GAY12178.1 hypothetical protein TOK_0570 [Pseudonocardia sp. N23]
METVEELFEQLVDEFVGRPGVTPPGSTGRFGSHALKVDGSIFAMLVRGALVLKLPRDRVTGLVATGEGGPFDAGRGRPMKEWVTVHGADPDAWRLLTQEAYRFVGAR